MLQIKTIYKQDPNTFDKAVNEALADGWAITRRTFDPHGFLAEMEKEIITEDERSCENCKHYANEAKDEPCASCTDSASNWETWDA